MTEFAMFNEGWGLVVVGLLIGLSAGVSPGPLLTLVITSTVEHGFGAGLRMALVPLATDLPILIIALAALSSIPDGFLTALALIGGLVVIFVGLENAWQARKITEPPSSSDASTLPKGDLLRALAVNAFSPHPWVSWLTILGPIVLGLTGSTGVLAATMFTLLFYFGLAGAKIVVAWGVARGRHRLSGAGYRRVSMICATVLIALGVLLFIQGFQDLRV